MKIWQRHCFRMSQPSCEDSNLSHCKSISSKAFDGAPERAYEVVDLRRAINIVAYLVMSIGMAVFIQFPNFQHHCQLGYKGIQFPTSFQAKHQKNLYIQFLSGTRQFNYFWDFPKMAIARPMGMGALSHIFLCLFVYLFVLQLCYRCATNLKCNVQRDSKLLYFAMFWELLLQYVLDFCIWTFVCLLYAFGALCQLIHIALSSIDHVEVIWSKYCDIVALGWVKISKNCCFNRRGAL